MPSGSEISDIRVEQFKRSRWNPIKDLTPQSLVRRIDEFEAGIYEGSAQLFWAVMRRAPSVKVVASKREMKAKSFKWEIVIKPGADDTVGQNHKEVLTYCYDNLIARDALDRDSMGGIQSAFGQMTWAQGMETQIHELIQKPSKNGLTYEMIACPLFFFEAMKGYLRFLQFQGQYEGVDMDPEHWMVTKGLGLMIPTSIAYLGALIPENDWLHYTAKYSWPLIIGQTNQSKDSDGWNGIKNIIRYAGGPDGSGLTNLEDIIKAIPLGNTGPLPFGDLVDKKHREIAALWMGGDLSTMSAGSGQSGTGAQVGASNQSEDQKCIEDHDAQTIMETLNLKIDRQVIEYHFGVGTVPQAYISVKPNRPPDVANAIAKLNACTSNGIPVAQSWARQELQIPKPQDGEDLVEKPEPVQPAGAFARNDSAANATTRAMDALQRNSLPLLASGKIASYRPLTERLQAIWELYDEHGEKAAQVALAKLQKDGPEILHAMNEASGDQITIQERIQIAALFNGMVESAIETHRAA